jgi:hypothetical protein
MLMCVKSSKPSKKPLLFEPIQPFLRFSLDQAAVTEWTMVTINCLPFGGPS